MRVAIANVQVPYMSGGAEALAQGLKAAIAAQGHPVEIVTQPFRFFPPEEVERSMGVWESEDFTRLNLYEPDRVICLRFPAYALRHSSKALWLCHQHRSAYELFDAARATEEERRLNARIAAFDARHLAAVPRRYTISRRVSERLRQSHAIESEAIYHPPPMAREHFHARAQPYVLFPSRVEEAKRQELLVRAMQHVGAAGTAVFAGEGGQVGAMKELAEKIGVAHRVRFLGRVGPEELLGLYAHCTAVCFTPRDEDYGYITLEAMLSSKPVITCSDSGGALEFVVEGETGHVVAPEPAAVAGAVDALLQEQTRAARLGRAGRAHYDTLVPGWDRVAEKLLAE